MKYMIKKNICIYTKDIQLNFLLLELGKFNKVSTLCS